MALTSRAIALLVALLATVWVAAVFWAPVAAAEPWTSWRGRAARLAYIAGAVVCHQRPERSFARAGRPLPVCGRCLGLYVGGLLGLWLGALWQARPPLPGATVRRLLVLAAVPTAATVIVEWVGLLPVTNPARALAALPLAVVAGWMLGTARWTERRARARAGA